MVLQSRGRTLDRVVDHPARIARAYVATLASLGFVVAAVVILLVAPDSEPAEAWLPPKTSVTAVARHTSLVNGPRVIRTDAHHAALALRVGYRARIMRPASAERVPNGRPSGERIGPGGIMTVSVVMAALLGACVGGLLVGLRGVRRLRSYAAIR